MSAARGESSMLDGCNLPVLLPFLTTNKEVQPTKSASRVACVFMAKTKNTFLICGAFKYKIKKQKNRKQFVSSMK